MSARRKTRQTIKTRDPKPTVRDPNPIVDVPEHPMIVRESLRKCKACGCTTWRGGGTSRPNVSTAEMARYRQCAKCKQAHWFMTPMTNEQQQKYLLQK